jgi:hypothetical protein
MIRLEYCFDVLRSIAAHLKNAHWAAEAVKEPSKGVIVDTRSTIMVVLFALGLISVGYAEGLHSIRRPSSRANGG